MSQQAPPPTNDQDPPPAADTTPAADPTPTTGATPEATTTPVSDLQTQLAHLQDEMARQATDADQHRIDLQSQLAEARTSIDTLSTQLADAAVNQADALRRVALAENAGKVVPELIKGETPEELAASVTVAREAYDRIAQDLRAQAAAQVPTGASPIAPPPMEELSSMQKITGGLSRLTGR